MHLEHGEGVEGVEEVRIETFEEFWSYYLGEHRVALCRIFHFVGTTLALFILSMSMLSLEPWGIVLALICGYGPAWVGHFFIENNRPATFQYPLWSLRADFVMWSLMLRGKLWSGDPLRPRR